MMREKILAFILVSSWTVPALSEVTRIEVMHREDVLSGREFGLAGAYEKLSGTAYFAVDPANPANQIITDIDKAPRNAESRVEWWADFYLLKPKDARRGNGTVFFDMGNRGEKRILHYFNFGDQVMDFQSEADFGDGFLLNEGFTLLWLGWQWDVATCDELMRVYVPIARNDGEPLRGLVRADFVVSSRVHSHRLADRGRYAGLPGGRSGSSGERLDGSRQCRGGTAARSSRQVAIRAGRGRQARCQPDVGLFGRWFRALQDL